MGRMLVVLLLLVLEFAHDVKPHTPLLPKPLLPCLELLDILHQRDQLLGQDIKLREHGCGSSRLQRGQECRGFHPQAVNVLLVTRHLFV